MAAKKATRKTTTKPAAAAPAPAAARPITPAGAPLPVAADEPTVDMGELPAARRKDPDATVVFAPLAGDAAHRAAREGTRLRPGSELAVRYDRAAEDVEGRGALARIEMGYRFDDGPVMMAVVADGQRSAQGALVRRTVRVPVPEGARRELQLWFRLQLADGNVLWDSAYARNHRFPVG